MPLLLGVAPALFYWTLLSSGCTAQGAAGGDALLQDEGLIIIYKTEIPWSPIPFTEQQHSSNIALHVALFSVVALVVVTVCFCYICWRYWPRGSARRHTSNVTITNSPSAIVTFQNRADSETATVNLRPGSARLGGVRSFFASRAGHNGIPAPAEDGPPNYSAVVASSVNPQFPKVYELETPPPAYVTIAPFK